MRFAGYLYGSPHQWARRGGGSARLTILCLGNSYTAGAGAPTGQDYASHLERMLRAEYPGKDIRVINWGKAMANTRTVLELLRKGLPEVRPDRRRLRQRAAVWGPVQLL